MLERSTKILKTAPSFKNEENSFQESLNSKKATTLVKCTHKREREKRRQLSENASTHCYNVE